MGTVTLPEGRKAVSPLEAFRLLGISRTVGYELLRTGAIRSVRAGRRRILVPIKAIDEYLDGPAAN